MRLRLRPERVGSYSVRGAMVPRSGSVTTSPTTSGWRLVWGICRVWGEVGGGDLEAVEEEAGAAGVELVGGEAIEDLADGLLDGGAVLGDGEGEGGGSVLALGEVQCGEGARGVGGAVVEAEVLVAERGAAAAVAAGEDVAALEATCGGCGRGVGMRHVGVPLPLGTFCKVFD